jgi:hypothetical protein
MKRNIIQKIIVVLIILLPLVSYLGCKKQPKCGCDGDMLDTYSLDSVLVDYSQIIYTIDSTSAVFRPDAYTTYYLCNPIEMYNTYKDLEGSGQILLSGKAFWECSFMMNSGSSSSYYYNYYKIFNLRVTGMSSHLYGK